MAGDIEAHDDGDHRAGDEFQRSRSVGGDLDRDARAFQRLAGDESLRPRPRRDAGDPLDRPEQVDERGDVVGSHVEHRPAAGEIVEGRARMPALMTGAHEEGGSGERPTDGAFVDQLAAGREADARTGIILLAVKALDTPEVSSAQPWMESESLRPYP